MKGEMMGLACPRCGERTQCLDSRPRAGGTARMRRRRCTSCQFRFTTHEYIATSTRSLMEGAAEALAAAQIAVSRLSEIQDAILALQAAQSGEAKKAEKVSA